MSQPKQPLSPATFTFVLIGIGWAEARLESGDISLEFVISYLCHPLGDLLEGFTSGAFWASAYGWSCTRRTFSLGC